MSLSAREVESPQSFPVVVTASRARPLVVLLVGYAVITGAGWWVGVERQAEIAAVFMVIATISTVVLSVIAIRRAAGRQQVLVVTSDAVTLGGRSISRRGLPVAIRSWKQAPLWTVVGTAIELVGRDSTLVIGGREHLPPRGAGTAATRVDASLSASEFVKLAHALGAESSLLDGPADDLEIDLAPSGTGFVGAYRTMAPWFGTMALAALIGVGSSALGLERHPVGLGVTLALTIAVIGGGLYLMFARSSRPPVVRYRLSVRQGSVQLVDTLARSGTHAIQLPPALMQRVTYRQVTRWGTYEYPALRIALSDTSRRNLVVGVWDTRLLWTSPTERTRRLDYLIGAEEWRLLLQALSLPSA